MIDNIIRRLSKPAYLFRPGQIARRIRNTHAATDQITTRLPWGPPLRVSRSEMLGACIARAGVYELVVTEAIWRLATSDDLACDVGANVGYFTSLLAHRCSEVVAF